MKQIRDNKTKKAFIEYLKGHPEERFFQALRNFCNMPDVPVNFVGVSEDGENYRDTFYFEADKMFAPETFQPKVPVEFRIYKFPIDEDNPEEISIYGDFLIEALKSTDKERLNLILERLIEL